MNKDSQHSPSSPAEQAAREAALKIERRVIDYIAGTETCGLPFIEAVIARAIDRSVAETEEKFRKLAGKWRERDLEEFRATQEINERLKRGETVTMTATIGYEGCPLPNRYANELESLIPKQEGEK